MYTILDRNFHELFQGTPQQVEDWLFENTLEYNKRLKVDMGTRMVPALEYIGA